MLSGWKSKTGLVMVLVHFPRAMMPCLLSLLSPIQYPAKPEWHLALGLATAVKDDLNSFVAEADYNTVWPVQMEPNWIKAGVKKKENLSSSPVLYLDSIYI